MIEVNVDELRESLKNCLMLVEQGDVVVITQHGKTIARILPAKENIEAGNKYDSGEVSTVWGGKPLSPWEPVAVNKGPELVSDLVGEDRDSGDDLI